MKNPPLFALAAAMLVAGCNSQPSAPVVVDSNPDPLKNVLAKAAPVELPPAIRADKTFRCKDNSLIYVVFFHGDKQANIRLVQNGPIAAKVTAPAAGEPLTAEGGWKLTGDTTNITITTPDKPSQTCHV